MENNHSSALLSKECSKEKVIALPFDPVSFDAGHDRKDCAGGGWPALLRAVTGYPGTEDAVESESRRRHQNHDTAW